MMDDGSIVNTNDRTLAIGSCITSAFSVAVLGLATHFFIRHEKGKEYDVSLVLEINAVQSVMAFIFILMLVTVSPETAIWTDSLSRVTFSGHTTALVLLLLCFFLIRALAAFSTCALTALGSGILPRALGGPRRLVVIAISIAFGLHDQMNAARAISALLMTAALGLYGIGGYQLTLIDENGDPNSNPSCNKLTKSSIRMPYEI